MLLVSACRFDHGDARGDLPVDDAGGDGSDSGSGSGSDDAGMTDATISAHACQSDAAYVPNPQTSVRYRAVATPLGWSAAQQDCASKGAHLVVIGDATEDVYIDGLLVTETWIGYSDIAVEGTFVWVTGASAGYTNWRPDGNPNDGSGTEPQDCTEIDEAGGTWNDENCPEPGTYVCECPPP